MASTVVWFDIPVSDMDRAIRFYEALTGQTLTRLPVRPGEETALFESGEKGDVSGSLFFSPDDKPSVYGSRVYLNANPTIDAWLARVEPAGGKIARGKTPIPGNRGVFAYIIDSEGNRVGLHAMA
jgi:predicted enzyme related to lactoylglutathione lyase